MSFYAVFPSSKFKFGVKFYIENTANCDSPMKGSAFIYVIETSKFVLRPLFSKKLLISYQN